MSLVRLLCRYYIARVYKWALRRLRARVVMLIVPASRLCFQFIGFTCGGRPAAIFCSFIRICDNRQCSRTMESECSQFDSGGLYGYTAAMQHRQIH